MVGRCACAAYKASGRVRVGGTRSADAASGSGSTIWLGRSAGIGREPPATPTRPPRQHRIAEPIARVGRRAAPIFLTHGLGPLHSLPSPPVDGAGKRTCIEKPEETDAAIDDGTCAGVSWVSNSPDGGPDPRRGTQGRSGNGERSARRWRRCADGSPGAGRSRFDIESAPSSIGYGNLPARRRKPGLIQHVCTPPPEIRR